MTLRRPLSARRKTGIGLLFMFSIFSGCAPLGSPPTGISTAERLSAFPAAQLPLQHEAVIYWSNHQIPFVEAGSDEDLAFLLGMLQAHLRLAQLEMLRRVSQGRLAEIAGPPAVDIDKAVRILDPGRAAAQIEAMLPPATRAYLENFIRGINYYGNHLQALPHEFKVAGIKYDPWSLRDVLILSRLLAADVNWIFFAELLPLLKEPEFPAFWERLLRYGDASIPGMGAAAGEPATALSGVSKSGSNSFVAGNSKSTSGRPIMGNDPHVGLNLPNLWLIAGCKSPTFNVAGLMLPGLPVFIIGRNLHIAWGGTNMMALSSDLVDLTEENPAAFSLEVEPISVRLWRNSEVTRRISRFGPVITDVPFLKDKADRPLALRWQGHKPSDEITSFLRLNQARDFQEFRRAFASYAVSGQNFTFADAGGNIGQVAAARLPLRRAFRPALIQNPADLTGDTLGPLDLPFLLNPPEDIVVSANNRPFSSPHGAAARFETSLFAASNDRVERISALLQEGPADIESAKSIQRDVFSPSSLRLRDMVISRFSRSEAAGYSPQWAPAFSGRQAAVLEELSNWDGSFDSRSRGALLMSLFVYYFSNEYYARRFGPAIRKYLLASQALNSFLLDDLRDAAQPGLDAALLDALRKTASKADDYGNWGEMHTLVLKHPLSRLPLAGNHYVFARQPAAGSTLTVMKTAHGMTDEVHETRYGANARHISDLSDPDENYFVLLGGQDGFLGSANFIDQLPLWNESSYIRVPLRPETARHEFPYMIRLAAGAGADSSRSRR